MAKTRVVATSNKNCLICNRKSFLVMCNPCAKKYEKKREVKQNAKR